MKGERNWIRSIRGPVTLITLGGLFALQNFTPYDFGQTWPVLLIVFGLLSLLARTVGPQPPVPQPPQYNWPPQQNWQQPWQPPSPAPSAPGGYRGTTYSQGPAAQPAGTPTEPGQTPGSSTPGGAA